ncbi:hypothetical protein C8J57DRAFT_679187 [Mycena rebaudengoi]|nr:hypothetical protein C8J57DRAFT_679187 [Mycena rebaudengoi]
MFKRARGRFAVMQMIAFFQWSAFPRRVLYLARVINAIDHFRRVYYENYVKLPPVLAALRMLPTVAGALCNVFVVFVISRIDLALLIVFGTSFTGVGALFFAIIRPSAPYWAYGFPSPIISVFGADFVFAAGTLFVAKVSLPHEQSLAGGLFQTLTQLGTVFGLAISTLAHNAVAGGHRGNDVPLKAYQAAPVDGLRHDYAMHTFSWRLPPWSRCHWCR